MAARSRAERGSGSVRVQPVGDGGRAAGYRARMAVRRKPTLLWRLFVITGVGTMTALVLSDDVWEQWEENVGDVVPRSTIRNVLAGTVGLHAVQAVLVHRSPRRNGIEHPARWAVATLLYGFPVARRLRRATRAVDAGE